MAIDFEAEGLLKGTRGRARDDRRRLLERLAREGVPLDELKRAIAEDRLALVPVERFLEGEGKRYTAAEVAERAGVDPETLQRHRSALGFPPGDEDAREYSDADVEAAKRLRFVLEAGLPSEGLLEATRVVGLSMSHIAAANNALVGEAMLHPGDTELEAAERYLGAAQALQPLAAPHMEYALNLHFREALRRAAVGRAELASGRLANSQEVTACFADLVDFTRLGEELPPEELGSVTGRLASLAGEVVAPPVRLVKMIGDAAMLVCEDPEPAVQAALDLIDAAEQEGEGFPGLRAGLACGPAVSRAGDWYGHPVNLASRITAIARPGSVLVTEEVAGPLGDGFARSFAGERRLKGIHDEVKLVRVRRAADEVDEPASPRERGEPRRRRRG